MDRAILTIGLAAIEANIVLLGLLVDFLAHRFLLQVKQVPLVQNVQEIFFIFRRQQHVTAFLWEMREREILQGPV